MSKCLLVMVAVLPWMLLPCVGGSRCEADEAAAPKVIVREPARRYPPVKVPAIASIPDGVDFGFAADVDGILQLGDWRVVGSVWEVHPNLIVFRTEKTDKEPSQIGRLAYRLPDGMSLDLAPGQPLTIEHDHEFVNKHFAYDMHISSDETLILATSHGTEAAAPPDSNTTQVIFSGSDRRANPFGVVFYWSKAEHRTELQPTNNSKQFDAPLTLQAKGQSTTQQVGSGDSAEIVLNGKKYAFKLLKSVHFEYGESDEQETSHTLEYLLVKKRG